MVNARVVLAGLPALLVLVAASAAVPSPPRVLAAADSVDGKRVDAYPALWWQWVNRKRWGAQAFQDPSGAQCALNQSGPVWFLAGTDGTDEVHRHCRIPGGKHVFLPVITMLASATPGRARSCAQLQADAADNNEHVVATEVSLDGVPVDIRSLRMASECFDAYAYSDFLEGTARGQNSATDGYWLMLAPLSDGTHSLRVDVHYENPGRAFGDMEQVFEYDLQVGGREPPPDNPEEGQDWRQTRAAGLPAVVASR
jgi:hypothetical protein